MKKISAIILLLFLGGCHGSQGPAGPAGPAGSPGGTGPGGPAGSPGGTRVAIFSGSVSSVPVSNICSLCSPPSGDTDFTVNVPQVLYNQNVSVNVYYQIGCSGAYFPMQGTSTSLEWYAVDFSYGAVYLYNMPNSYCYLVTVAY